MCFNVKKKKYTYLSMCSCCNVVSKYSSTIRKHLQGHHSKRGVVAGAESRVIPIRIENKFEKIIKRTLDKTTKHVSILSESGENLCLKGSSRVVESKGIDQCTKEVNIRDQKKPKCSICNIHLSDHVSCLHHLSTVHSDRNIRINFSCPVCNASFLSCMDLQKHVKKEHREISPTVSYMDCMHIEKTEASLLLDQMQCPYCELLFAEQRQIQDHVRVSHSDYIETVSFKCENDENVQQKVAEIVLAMYSCRSCGKSFHTVLDLREHCLLEHTSSIANSKPLRKRKLPKWLEREENVTEVKKQKTRRSESDKNPSLTLSNRERSGKKAGVAKIIHQVQKHENQQSVKEKKMNKKKAVENSVERVKKTKEIEIQQRETQSFAVDFPGKDESESANSNIVEQVNLEAKDDDFDLNHNGSEPDFGDSDDDFIPEQSDDDFNECVEKTSENLNCTFCGKTFLSKRLLYAHLKKKHNTDMKEDLNCYFKSDKRTNPKRSAKLSAKDLEDDEKYVTRYKCPFCELYLYHYEYIRSHVQQSHPELTNFRIYMREIVKLNSCEENWEYFRCPNPKCEFVCKKKTALQDHVTCAKGKFKNEKILCSLPSAWMEKLENTVSLICPQCDTVVQGKVSYENHLKEHFPDKTFEVQLSSTLPPPLMFKPKDRQLAKVALKEVECSICPYCELATTQKAQLSKHFKRFHSNQSGSSVISCVLANQSSVKETAKLIVKNTEDVTPADNTEPKVRNEICNIAKHSGETTNETVESETELLTGIDTGCTKDWSDEKEHVQTIYIQSKIPVGTYLCPLCDFKTSVKKDIKIHMDDHNNKTDEDTDSIYVIPDKWIKLEEKDRQLKCQFCDFSSHLNLTLGFRHILDCHKDVTVNEPDLSSGPLFEMVNVTVEGVREKYERQKYRCTTCVPGFIFKTRKGLQLHLKTIHKNPDSLVVYESLYQMLDLVADSCDTRLTYMCCLCEKGIFSKLELMDHFHAEHPENLGELVNRLNTSSKENDGTDGEQTKCGVCDMQFTDVQSLKHHLILHVNRYKPTCELCQVCFTNRAELHNHEMEVHCKTGEMCDICGAMFPSTAVLDRHVKAHAEPPKGLRRMVCPHCGTSVMGKNMPKHMVDKHIELVSCNCDICRTQQVPEWKKSVKCNLCDAIFCTWYNLKGHEHREHSPQQKNMYKCRRCNLRLPSRKDQAIHNHTCGKATDFLQLVSNFDQDDTGEGTPPVSEITLTEEANIDFSRGLAYIRQQYVQVNSDAEKPFGCKLCPSTFTKVSYVYNHLKRMHTRDEMKRLRCKICKMGFMGKKEFQAHCRTHMGLRQYQCQVCQKSYKTQAHLKEHKQIHLSQIYRYPCGYCGLEFNQRGALLAHVVHHDKLKPFKCLFCEKGYTTLGDLQRHMANYSKRSKYAGTKNLTFCGYCSKDFPNHNALVKHFQIHLPVSPFECTVCQERFSSFRQMYNHKSRKAHFTDTDIIGGQQDLKAPGRKFRNYQVSKRKTEIIKERKGNTENGEESTPDNTLNTLTDHRNLIEIEMHGSGAETDERAKVVLDEFESDVIRSMLDADPEVFNTIDFQSANVSASKEKPPKEYGDGSVLQDGYHYEIPDENNYQTNVITMQEMYEVNKRNSYISNDEPSQTRTVSDNIDDLASAVAENIQHQQQSVPGKTQTFQASDGSIIHVCVIKPDR